MNLKSLPDRNTIDCQSPVDATPTIDQFFRDTKNYLIETYHIPPHDFERTHQELAHSYSEKPSDEGVEMLRYRGRVVAIVTVTRCEFNHWRYGFFRDVDGIERHPMADVFLEELGRQGKTLHDIVEKD